MTSTQKEKITTRQVFSMIFKDRQVLAVLILGLASGLPYAAVGGTLNAWMTTAGVKTSTIGLLSWAGLAYAFKFTWAAALQSRRTPFRLNIGPRRFWMFVFQILITIGLFIIAFSHPEQGVGKIALLAVLIAVASASFDIVSAAWKIEIARDDHHLDILATTEQFGYRFSSLLSGFVAFLLAEQFGWRPVFIGGACLMATTIIGVIIAQPIPLAQTYLDEKKVVLREGINLSPKLRHGATLITLVGWLVAFYLIGSFMFGAIHDPEHFKIRDFMRHQSPIVIGLTVGVLCISSAYLVYKNTALTNEKNKSITSKDLKHHTVLDILYIAIIEPMMEIIRRFKWATVLILALVMTYRFTDAIWGSFAYPFYMGENYGALGHTLTEVGVASKFFGIIATVLGIALGGFSMLKFGRLPVLVFGAIIAAATNFIYADLAGGAHGMDTFLRLTYLDSLVGNGNKDFFHIHLDQRMMRLIVTIFIENLAGGIASAAIIAYLSSIVNKNYAAVQYALLVSLTFLFGTLGRPLIGEIIEDKGFAYTFILCAWLGIFAVVLAILEWIRQIRTVKKKTCGLTS